MFQMMKTRYTVGLKNGINSTSIFRVSIPSEDRGSRYSLMGLINKLKRETMMCDLKLQ